MLGRDVDGLPLRPADGSRQTILDAIDLPPFPPQPADAWFAPLIVFGRAAPRLPSGALGNPTGADRS